MFKVSKIQLIDCIAIIFDQSFNIQYHNIGPK